jgi:Tfp pilus assembly protein PilF
MNSRNQAYRKCLSVNANNLAWSLATCSDPDFRDTQSAIEYAERAVDLQPRLASGWNTLGTAYYRSGQYDEAIAAFDRSMKLSGGNSFDWFFLAMIHSRLGDQTRAHEWYDRASDWMERECPEDEELLRFREEADQVMGEQEKGTPNDEASSTAGEPTDQPDAAAGTSAAESSALNPTGRAK